NLHFTSLSGAFGEDYLPGKNLSAYEALFRLQGYTHSFVDSISNGNIAYNYPSMLFALEQLDIRLASKEGLTATEQRSIMYANIVTKFDGLLRDQLLLLFAFQTIGSTESYYSHLISIEPLLVASKSKEILAKLKANLSPD